MKQMFLFFTLMMSLLSAYAENPASTEQQSNATTPATDATPATSTKDEEPKPPKSVPVQYFSENQRFFQVIGEVHCTGNSYAPANLAKGCRNNTCKSGLCFVDTLDPVRQNTQFNPRIEQADAILYNPSDLAVNKPKGGAGTFVLSLFQNGGRNLVSVDVPGIAVKWTEPTAADFENGLNKRAGSDARYQRLQRPILMRLIRDKKLIEHAPKLYAYLPEQTGRSIEDWAQSSENLMAAEILVAFKDSSAATLAPSLEKVLRYSTNSGVRLSCARLLIKLGRQDVVDAVAKESPDIRQNLNRLLLES